MERYFGLKKIKINTLKTFGRRLFTYHRGKIIGSLVGLLTGLRLFGLLFGLLFGSLVDTIIEHYRLQREVELFEGKGKLSKTPAGRVAAAAICALETADSAKRTITGLDAYGTAAGDVPAEEPTVPAENPTVPSESQRVFSMPRR